MQARSSSTFPSSNLSKDMPMPGLASAKCCLHHGQTSLKTKAPKRRLLVKPPHVKQQVKLLIKTATSPANLGRLRRQRT